MAAAEMYDYLTTITPDYDAAIGIVPQGVVTEESSKAHVIHFGVDGSEERISLGSTPIFYITIGWDILSAANSGTIMDFYNDPAKANGCQRSFKYAFGDGHTYVVRFDSMLPRSGRLMSKMGIQNIRLKVLGRIADA
jgi:hypothetical protein